MSIPITMPRLSDTMESGTLLKWNVNEGEAVSSGDVVADVETDKATMELTVFDDGTMARLVVQEGQTVDVGAVIAVLAEDGEDLSDAASSVDEGAAAAGGDGAAEPESATAVDEPPPTGSAPDSALAARESDGGRLRVSPVARRLADEHRIDLTALDGSGPSGRIIKRDVLKAIETADETVASRAPSAQTGRSAPSEPGAAIERSASSPVTPITPAAEISALPGAPSMPAGRVELSNMRQTIARRLVESSSTIPHYQVSMTFDMDPLMELRKTLNAQLAPVGVKLSVNDFLVRGCALAMYEHPEFNASWNGDSIVIHGAVNIGIAIAVGEERGGGLVVGVVRHADQKSLRAISLESKNLAEKARTRGLSVEEMSDSTFTLSNLGMFGVEHFTAIINPPNSAILAVGGAIKKPVVRNDELTIGHEMTATISSDHRVIDGAMAAGYLKTLKSYVENPAALVV